MKISYRTFNPQKAKRLWSSSSPTSYLDRYVSQAQRGWWKQWDFPGWIHSYHVFQILASHSCQLKVSSKIIIFGVLFGVPSWIETSWSASFKKIAQVSHKFHYLFRVPLTFWDLFSEVQLDFCLAPRDVHADQFLAKHAKVIWSATVASEKTKSGWSQWTQFSEAGTKNLMQNQHQGWT